MPDKQTSIPAKQKDEELLHKMDGSVSQENPNKKIIIGLGVVIIVAGILTGKILSKNSTGSSNSSQGALNPLSGNKKVVGSNDTKTFSDSAEGTLQQGGIDGEGTHKLIRPGGDSQTVYLTSSVLDLEQFVGKKVKVWGQTHSAKTAGWFMDVGRVELKE